MIYSCLRTYTRIASSQKYGHDTIATVRRADKHSSMEAKKYNIQYL